MNSIMKYYSIQVTEQEPEEIFKNPLFPLDQILKFFQVIITTTRPINTLEGINTAIGLRGCAENQI